MPDYRVYTKFKIDQLYRRAQDVACPNDAEAVRFGQLFTAAGGYIEIWQGVEKIFPVELDEDVSNPLSEALH